MVEWDSHLKWGKMWGVRFGKEHEEFNFKMSISHVRNVEKEDFYCNEIGGWSGSCQHRIYGIGQSQKI